MRKLTALFFAWLVSTVSVPAQQRPLTCSDIVEMVKSGVSEELIIQKILPVGNDCYKNQFARTILSQAGASGRLIDAVMAAKGSAPAYNQNAPRPIDERTRATVFGGYSYARSEGDLGGFNWHGFNGSVSGHVTDWLAIKGDLSGHWTEVANLLDVSMFTFSAGPEFTRRTGRVRGFGHLLGGGARLGAGLLGVSADETAFATLVGGGVDVGAGKHFAIRVFQSDWVRLWDIGGTGEKGDFLRLSFGIVGRF